MQAAFANVHLNLNFEEMAGTKDRGIALAAIQKELLSLPSGYAGELFSHASLPARLHAARVFRNNRTDGPHFNAPSAGGWMPPQLDKIEEKLSGVDLTNITNAIRLVRARWTDNDGKCPHHKTIRKWIRELRDKTEKT